MLKQPCQSLNSHSSCVTSYTQNQGTIASQVAVKKAEVSSLLSRAVAWVAIALTVRNERRTLAELTQQQLQDVGVSREEARRESKRAYWDLPSNRSQLNGSRKI